MKKFLNTVFGIELLLIFILLIVGIWAGFTTIIGKLLATDVILMTATMFFYYGLELDKEQPKKHQS